MEPTRQPLGLLTAAAAAVLHILPRPNPNDLEEEKTTGNDARKHSCKLASLLDE